jgi:hypothetical protein
VLRDGLEAGPGNVIVPGRLIVRTSARRPGEAEAMARATAPTPTLS